MSAYRKAVLAIVLHKNNVLIIKKPEVGWQFPQGGIEPEEAPRDAIIRELNEEIGLVKERVLKITESRLVRTYEWPPAMQAEKRLRGQRQRVFVITLADPSVQLNREELSEYLWVAPSEALQMLSFEDLRSFALQVFREEKLLL